eukprot:9708024-Prorocentrum_lima.AAC.1
MDLHDRLIEQLDVCRSHQGPKAEPVNVPPPGEQTVEVLETQVGQHDTMGAAEFSHRSDEEWVALMKRQMTQIMEDFHQ